MRGTGGTRQSRKWNEEHWEWVRKQKEARAQARQRQAEIEKMAEDWYAKRDKQGPFDFVQGRFWEQGKEAAASAKASSSGGVERDAGLDGITIQGPVSVAETRVSLTGLVVDGRTIPLHVNYGSVLAAEEMAKKLEANVGKKLGEIEGVIWQRTGNLVGWK